MIVAAFVARPKGHFRKSGELSAVAVRAGLHPTTKPDADNIRSSSATP